MSSMLLTVLLHLLLMARPLPDDSFFLGRWDMTVTDTRGRQLPSWLEVTRDGESGGALRLDGARETLKEPHRGNLS